MMYACNSSRALHIQGTRHHHVQRDRVVSVPCSKTRTPYCISLFASWRDPTAGVQGTDPSSGGVGKNG